MSILNRSKDPASRVEEYTKGMGPDWQGIGSSMRSIWKRRAPDVAQDPSKLRTFADEHLAKPIADLPSNASNVAPAITGAVLAAVPQVLDAVAKAVRDLSENVSTFAEAVPESIDSVRRRRRPPFWRRPLPVALGLGIVGTVLLAWWAATSTTAIDSIRHSVRQARRRFANGSSTAETTMPIDRSVTGYSSGGSGYTDTDMAHGTTRNGLPPMHKGRAVDASDETASGGPPADRSYPGDAARGATDPVADVETANSESWVPVGPESAAEIGRAHV